MKRLLKSVIFDANGRPQILSFDLADQEWRENTQHLKAPGYGDAGRPTLTGVAPERLSVTRDRELVVLAWQRFDGEDVDELEQWFLVPMDPAVARYIGERLIALSGTQR